MKPKAVRRAEAEVRNAAWAALTPEQQLKYLDETFPTGAKRQKARIDALLKAKAEAKTEAKAEAKPKKEKRRAKKR